jgi:hypothetical protein
MGGQSLQIGIVGITGLTVSGTVKSRTSINLGFLAVTTACKEGLERVFIDGTKLDVSVSIAPCVPGGNPNLNLDPNTATIMGDKLLLGRGCLLGNVILQWNDIPPLTNTEPDPKSAR